jgi:cytochrome c biogenesis protein CcmG, thiol:disulfide interchange protein DsbE
MTHPVQQNRSPRRRAAIPAALVLIGLLATGCYGGGGPGRRIDGTGGPASLAGAPGVSFDLPLLGGATDSLARHRGSVVVMNFWATWCPPCKEEMPALEQLAREDRGRGLVVLGIDQGESADAARGFVRAHGITFPILLDADQKYASSYVSIGLPTTVIIGRDGHVVRGIDGAQTLAQFRTAVAPVLAAR